MVATIGDGVTGAAAGVVGTTEPVGAFVTGGTGLPDAGRPPRGAGSGSDGPPQAGTSNWRIQRPMALISSRVLATLTTAPTYHSTTNVGRTLPSTPPMSWNSSAELESYMR